MPTTQPLPPKKEVALALLERSSVYLHLDPRSPAVIVPVWFKKQPQLVLQVGLNMPVPIHDLNVDEMGVSCTLSFNRSPFYCAIPWGSIFAMVGDDGRGMIWPDDMPAEIARQAQLRPVESPGATIAEATPAKQPRKTRATAKTSREPRNGANADGAPAKRPRKRSASSAAAETEPLESGKPKSATAQPAQSDRVTSIVKPPAPIPLREPTSRPALGQARKKRELPPYLRVVK